MHDYTVYKERICQSVQGAKGNTNVLAHGNKERPLMLCDFDKRVQQYLRNLRLAGGVVNHTVAVAAARGIIRNANSTLFKETGGVDVSEARTTALLVRMNYVRRKNI